MLDGKHTNPGYWKDEEDERAKDQSGIAQNDVIEKNKLKD